MAFTKINAAGIGTTETVTVDGLTVINDGSFGGNLTVGGVLTYEDVTNVDSVGLITARNGIVVGSGITLSKDGDIFATGITTVSGNVKVGTGITLSPDGDGFYTGVVTATTFSGSLAASNLTGALPAISGANLTNLDASDLASGTVPTARLGSGTASSSTFLAGDSTFKTVTGTTINNNADNRLITGSGTANTLEGEANITFDGTSLNLLDHKNIYLGTGNDLRIWHDANNSYSQISGQNHSLYIDGATTYMRTSDGSSGVENAIVMNSNGSVDLYHSGTKKFETTSSGVTVTGHLTVGTATLYSTGNFLLGDDDEIRFGAGEDLQIYHGSDTNIIDSTGKNLQIKHSSDNAITSLANAGVHLYYDDELKLSTTSQGADIQAEGSAVELRLKTDGGTLRGYVYGNNSNEFGFLSSAGNWPFKHTLNSKTEFYIGGNLELRLDGDGLKFNGDTAATNALDDYEEGTFTPTNVSGSGVADSWAGRYTKIGNIVHFQINQTGGSYGFSPMTALAANYPYQPLHNGAFVVTNGNPNISGTGLTYANSNKYLYWGFSASGQSYVVISGTYITS